ncbi:MAG: hypothetical protein IJ647_04115 [Prevotella sp.]|nr:hypothetical protein [Prevotella sp.]
MKKIILTSIFTALFSVVSFGQTLQRTILSHYNSETHQVTLTQYNLNEWMSAFDDAVNGDTIYFTSGTFEVPWDNNGNGNNMTIDKVITLIGSGVSYNSAFFNGIEAESDYSGCYIQGEGTTLNATITISIDGNPTLTSTFMEGVNLQNGNISITKPVNNLVIKRSQIRKDSETSAYGGSFSTSSDISGLTIENCFIRSFDGNNLTSAEIRNSWIGEILNLPSGFNVFNCVITGMTNCTNSNYINCVIQNWAEYNTYQNCLLSIGDTSNCTINNSCALYHYGVPQNYTQSQLSDVAEGGWAQDANWTWLDDVVPGVFTGSAPFTFLPSQPYVSSSSVAYDASTKKLNVNITVNKGK